METRGKFRLSVQGADLRKDHWVLQNRAENGIYYTVGSVLEPFEKFKPSFQLLSFLLNDDDCFEINYKAKNGDRLELFINGISYCFAYEHSRWEVLTECEQEAA